jgi:hypothetical protein
LGTGVDKGNIVNLNYSAAFVGSNINPSNDARTHINLLTYHAVADIAKTGFGILGGNETQK